jgi:sugar lactone lactonase YvrE
MCRWLVVVMLMLALAVGDARARLTPAQKCAAGKERAAGAAMAAKLVCYVKARATGRAVRSACIRQAAQKFEARFAKRGKACPGAAPSVEILLDACVGTLVDDALGTGQCPVRAAKAIGRAGYGFMACAAKDLARPGSLNACDARQSTTLNAALSNAQRCVPSSTASDLGAECIMPLLNALPVALQCGTFLTTWGSQGSGPGQFAGPAAVAVDGVGNVYVADSFRIEKFDSTGTFLTAWGSQGSGPGQFFGAGGIAVDGSANVYVTDTGNLRVQKFDTTGTFFTAWGSYGLGPGQFERPGGVAVDSSGNVYVTDSGGGVSPSGGTNRIEKFDSTGTFLATFGSQGSSLYQLFGAVAVDRSGNVYVVDGNTIQKFDSTGTFLTAWGSQGSGPGQFFFAGGIAVDARGNVFLTDSGNARVERFDSTGTFLASWGSLDPDGFPVAGEFSFPTGVAVDPSGNVYVADRFRIDKFACP